jgi:phosphatidylglycerophosphate synthase
MPDSKPKLIKAGLIPDWLDDIFLASVTPLIRFFSGRRINPNWITAMSLILALAASAALLSGKLFLAAVILAVSGIFDFVDGKVAKRLGRVTAVGGILDSVLDRYSDMALFSAMVLYFALHGFLFAAAVALLAMSGAMITSYTKALAASYGFRFRMGAVRRQERISLILVGLVFNFLHEPIRALLVRLHVLGGEEAVVSLPLVLVICFLAVFSNLTAIQRLCATCRMAKVAEGNTAILQPPNRAGLPAAKL